MNGGGRQGRDIQKTVTNAKEENYELPNKGEEDVTKQMILKKIYKV